ncbi:MAG TPA: hypothetical protein VFA08_01635 [Actinomycetota bacterium]|jgi:hypothetical protein|nr:hypothetical protein [Actinomycetota bacterium]
MRLRFGLVALVAIVLILSAQTAMADGGAYIEFRGPRPGSHFLPGDDASGTAFVAIPKRHEELLNRGPFYVYLVPGNKWIQEGKALPEGVIRLAAATIERDSGTTFEITTSFTVPDVPGEYYTIQFCNDPCTISGFRESLSGQISIVQTLREASLLNEQQRLYGKNWHLRRQVRKATKEIEDLQLMIDSAGSERSDLIQQIDDLEAEIIRDQQAPAEIRRPLAEAWALVALGIAVVVALTSIGLGIVFARRRDVHTPFVVPDTIAELDREREDTLARA